MAYELKKEGTIKGIGDIFYVAAHFNEASALLTADNLKHISARDIAFARINSGKDSSFSKNGSYIKEGVLYLPAQKKNIVLTRNSQVLKNPKAATAAHGSSKEFFVSESIKFGKNDYAVESTDSIPTDRFAEEGLTQWLFKDKAQDYGLFLKDAGIKAMPLNFNSQDYIAKQGKPYANQLWLARLGYYSLVGGNGRFLGGYDGVRGVHASANPRSGRAQKNSISLPYNNKQIDSLSKIVEGVKAGDIPASKLEKIADFLTKIRKA